MKDDDESPCRTNSGGAGSPWRLESSLWSLVFSTVIILVLCMFLPLRNFRQNVTASLVCWFETDVGVCLRSCSDACDWWTFVSCFAAKTGLGADWKVNWWKYRFESFDFQHVPVRCLTVFVVALVVFSLCSSLKYNLILFRNAASMTRSAAKKKTPSLQPWRAQAAVNTVPQPDLVYLRNRWLTCCHNTGFRISLIQQPEPSVSEAAAKGDRI
jgi:hypothetical protein